MKTRKPSKPAIGRWRRSLALRASFARALAARTTRAAVIALQTDYTRERKLSAIHRRELDLLVEQRLTAGPDP
jgi:hypothetical protein